MPLCNRRIKSTVHDWYLERWNDAWLKLKTCRNATYVYPRVITEKHIAGGSVSDLNQLDKVGTGHGFFKKHLPGTKMGGF